MNYTQLASPISLGEYEVSIGAMLAQRADTLHNRTALRVKEKRVFKEISWHAFYDFLRTLGVAFMKFGLKPGDKVAIYSCNRQEMLSTELALMSIGSVAVPIFSEYPPRQLDYILQHSDAKILVVSDLVHFEILLKTKAFNSLQRVFVMECPPGYCFDYDNVHPFATLCNHAEDLGVFDEQVKTVDGETPCLLMYTSGTTGMPKGVLLCHRNILSQQKALSLLWDMGPDDRMLSYLPWHHSFGGIFEIFRALYCGASLAIDEGCGKDVCGLIDNFSIIKPTVFFSVPLIYKRLVEQARESEKRERELIHDELKFVFTAAAPLPAEIAAYFKSKHIPVVEGWGLTETSPCVTLTSLTEQRHPNTVGFPIPGVSVRLSDDGEILVKGPNVMLEYYKAPDKTRAAIDPDGWFHTGDLGDISEHGVVIKGRVDGVFKLSNAEKVSAQEVETTVLNSTNCIETIVVAGSGEDYVAALIQPNKMVMETWAREFNVPFNDSDELMKHPLIIQRFVETMKEINEKISPKYARIRAFAFITRELSLEKGERTPSFKVVRKAVLENFKPLVDKLFQASENKSADAELHWVESPTQAKVC